MEPPKFHRENRGTARKPNYAVRYVVESKRYREPTGASTLVDYNAYVAQLRRRFELEKWKPPSKDAPREGETFAGWWPNANAKRVAAGVRSAADDEAAHCRLHLEPEFGALLLDELTFKRIVDGFANIRAKGLSGSTMRNIHVTFQAVMRLAAKEGHIAQVPSALSVLDGELPPVVCTRPEGWRREAKFTREEIATLLACEEVEMQYRVMYCAYFLTGSRFAELTMLKVRDWDRDRQPLGALTIRALKTRRDKGPLYRQPPVHPTLQAWLTWWLRVGYGLVHGLVPKPDDLIFPTCSARRRNAAARPDSKAYRCRDCRSAPVRCDECQAQLRGCSHGEVFKRWQRHHLPAAGLRHRRLHDARGTLISILRSAGSNRDIVRSITHKAVEDKVLDEGYTVFEWDAVCNALARVDFRLPGPPSSEATVVDIRRYGRRTSG